MNRAEPLLLTKSSDPIQIRMNEKARSLESLNFIRKAAVNEHLVPGWPKARRQRLGPFENGHSVRLWLPYGDLKSTNLAQSEQTELPHDRPAVHRNFQVAPPLIEVEANCVFFVLTHIKFESHGVRSSNDQLTSAARIVTGIDSDTLILNASVH
jgi:hypothetical protein